MHQALRGLLLALFISLAGFSAPATAELDQTNERNPINDQISPKDWNKVCGIIEGLEVNGLDCDGLKPPIVIVSPIIYLVEEEPGVVLRGLYMPGDIFVFVAHDLDPDRQKSVAIHESVHYILYFKKGKVPTCTAELAARVVTHVWQGSEYDPTWETVYGCKEELAKYAP